MPATGTSQRSRREAVSQETTLTGTLVSSRTWLVVDFFSMRVSEFLHAILITILRQCKRWASLTITLARSPVLKIVACGMLCCCNKRQQATCWRKGLFGFLEVPSIQVTTAEEFPDISGELCLNVERMDFHRDSSINSEITWRTANSELGDPSTGIRIRFMAVSL